jgi:ribosomal protein L37AE/L43A
MSFDDIPEDREQSYPCPEDCGGNVVEQVSEDGIMFECDKCDWRYFQNHHGSSELGQI